MERIHILPNLHMVMVLYNKYLSPAAKSCQLRRVQLDILLFLANNPELDTAIQIHKIRRIPKSSLSQAISELEEDGYIRREYRDGNRKNAHLILLEKSEKPVELGRQAQDAFYAMMFRDIDESRLVILQSIWNQMMENCMEKWREKEC